MRMWEWSDWLYLSPEIVAGGTEVSDVECEVAMDGSDAGAE